jgi:hypothetical protein
MGGEGEIIGINWVREFFQGLKDVAPVGLAEGGRGEKSAEEQQGKPDVGAEHRAKTLHDLQVDNKRVRGKPDLAWAGLCKLRV